MLDNLVGEASPMENRLAESTDKDRTQVIRAAIANYLDDSQLLAKDRDTKIELQKIRIDALAKPLGTRIER